MSGAPVYDVCLNDYPRLPGDHSDSERILRAVAACPRGVLYISAGLYQIATPLKVTNLCSLMMHKSAVLQAVVGMDYILTCDMNLQHNKEANGGAPEDYNLFIRGGDLDGNGLAGCLQLVEYHHFTLKDISLRNGKRYGLKVDGYGHGYELIATNVYCKCTIPGLAGNAGISTNGGDSHYTDCVIVDYTVGIEVNPGSGANRLTRCHVWGGLLPPRHDGEDREMLVDSVCFKLGAGDTLLRDCYADTAKIGFLVTSNTRILGSAYFNNYHAFKMDNTVGIRHERGNLLVADCCFTKTSPHTKVYEGSGENVIWRDNVFNGFNPADIPREC